MKKKKRIYLKAYINGNLGDDLFVQILCNRYVKERFYVFGAESERGLFELENISYIIDKNLLWRIILKLQRMFAKLVNNIFQNRVIKPTYCEKYLESKLISKVDYNIYIVGSAFMNYSKITEDEKKDAYFYFEKKPYIIGSNFGPFQDENFYKMYKKLFSMASDVCFRDSYSKSLFSNLNNIRNEMDVVFSYELGEENILPNKFENYILISVVSLKKDNDDAVKHEEMYINYIRKCILYYLKRNKKIILIGFCKNQNDHIVINEIMKEIHDSENILIYNYPDINYKEAVGLFSKADEVIASRYHAMVLAILYRKKVYSISYNEKMSHVLNDIDSKAPYIKLEELEKLSVEEMIKSKGYLISEKRLNEIVQSSEKQFYELDKLFNY